MSAALRGHYPTLVHPLAPKASCPSHAQTHSAHMKAPQSLNPLQHQLRLPNLWLNHLIVCGRDMSCGPVPALSHHWLCDLSSELTCPSDPAWELMGSEAWCFSSPAPQILPGCWWDPRLSAPAQPWCGCFPLLPPQSMPRAWAQSSETRQA